MAVSSALPLIASAASILTLASAIRQGATAIPVPVDPLTAMPSAGPTAVAAVL